MNIIKKYYKHLLIFALFATLSNIITDQFFQNQKKNYLTIQTTLLQTQYQTQYRYLKIMSRDIYEMYQDNEKLITLFAQAQGTDTMKQTLIRDKMYNMLQRRYKRLVNMGVIQLHFHLQDNTIFLRMNEPKKSATHLTRTRDSVIQTNRTKRPQEGFEVCSATPRFQYVYPLFDKHTKHIGSMEISFSSESLIQNITDKYIITKHLLVLKSEVLKNTLQEGVNSNYTNSLESKKYFVKKIFSSDIKNKTFKQVILKNQTDNYIKRKMLKGETFSISNSYNFNSIVVTYIAIEDFSNIKNIAYLVIYTESDHINTLLLESYYAKALLNTLLLLLFIFSIYVTITQHRLEEMAHFDKLTGLPNRANFYISLEREIKRATRLKQNFSLMFIDLDGFKTINDTYGHNAGDEILIQTAKRLEQSIRKMDLVARIGGDEFIILLDNVNNEASGAKVAQKIIDSLNQEFKVSNKILHIGASIGISLFPKNGNDIDTIVSTADEAMYLAKENGKNSFVSYSDKIKFNKGSKNV